jgi:hypothetical protein
MACFPTSSVGLNYQGYPIGPSAEPALLISGASDTKGAWVTLVASATFESNKAFLFFEKGANNGGRRFLVDLAVGPAGFESTIWANIQTERNTISSAWCVEGIIELPWKIPVGSRVSARCQASAASQNLTVGISLIDAGDCPGFTGATTYGAFTVANTDGTAFDPGPTIDTKGAWTTLAASSIEAQVLVLSLGTSANVVPSNTIWALDIAIGPAASEVVIVSDLRIGIGNTSRTLNSRSFTIPVFIPSGSRVSVRASCSINNATDRVLTAVLLLAGGNSATCWPQNGTGVDTVTYPVGPTAAGITVTTDVNPDTKGLFSEIIASTGFASNKVRFQVIRAEVGANIAPYFVDFAIGAPGSETVIFPNALVDARNTPGSEDTAYSFWDVPVLIPAGTRISARAQFSGGTASARTVQVCVTITAAGDCETTNSYTNTGANPTDTTGIQVDPSGLANTKGPWIQLDPSTAITVNDYVIMFMTPGLTLDTRTWRLDIGIGPAGFETALIKDLWITYGHEAGVPSILTPKSYSIPVYIPMGTRVVARASCDITNLPDRLLVMALQSSFVGTPPAPPAPPNPSSGIYKVVPDKRNDTLWVDLDAKTTIDKKIPNPFIKTGLIGE